MPSSPTHALQMSEPVASVIQLQYLNNRYGQPVLIIQKFQLEQ